MSGRSPAYRSDIDGLRAVAILSVIAYHAAPSVAPGGLVGVDVFFVISGFLITGIVTSGLREGTFRLSHFFDRRIRRIIPALVVVTAAVLAFGGLVLFPPEFRLLGRDVLASSTFTSNLALYHDGAAGDYFGVGADLRPLLHLWSLGVEEQFYIIWPIALLVAWRQGRSLRWWVGLVGAASFSLSAYFWDVQPAAAFYLPVCRAWELLLGGMLALHGSIPHASEVEMAGWTRRRLNLDIASLAGLALIVAAVTGRARGGAALWTIFATVGAALTIMGGTRAWPNRTLLSSRVLVFVGLISYPLYLWHWPVLVLARVVYGRLTPNATMIALVSSALLAVATYRLVERPLRRRAPRELRVLLALLLVTLGVLGLGAHSGRIQPVVTTSAPALVAAAGDWGFPGSGRVERTSSGLTVVSAGSSRPARTVVFVGDSHVEQYWPRVEAMREVLALEKVRVSFVVKSGCPPLPSVNRIKREYRSCDGFARRAYAFALEQGASTVVMGAYWEFYFLAPFDSTRGLADRASAVYEVRDTAQRPLVLASAAGRRVLVELSDEVANLRMHGVAVVVLASNVTARVFDPRSMVGRRLFTDDVSPPMQAALYAHYAAPVLGPIEDAVESAGGRVVDPIAYLCPEGICPMTTSSGDPLYRDGNHVRARTARTLRLVDAILWPVAETRRAEPLAAHRLAQ